MLTHHADANPEPSESSPLTPSRRQWLVMSTLLAAGALVRGTPSHALSLGDLTQRDATAGIRTALEKGAEVAIQLLGKENGFWQNDQVRIALPDWLRKTERAIKLVGRGKDLDDLKLGINRAAEQAVPQSKLLLTNAVKAMNVDDAKKILTGGDASVTAFFREKTQAPLTDKFLPVVSGVTNRIGLAKQYNQLAQQIAQTGLVKLTPEQARVERHVTTEALNGLYHVIGEEEKKLRANPAGAASDLLRRVFGAIK